MKAIQTFLILATLVATASAQSKSQAAGEQRFFNIEDAIQPRVELSDAELSVLANDDLMRKELGPASAGSNLTQEGLEAAIVHLCGPSERDLVVMGNGAAFVGANVGPFWIVRDLTTGPTVVLSEMSLGLTVDSQRSNKCFNVEATAATSAERTTTTEFRFNGEKYVVHRQRSGKPGR